METLINDKFAVFIERRLKMQSSSGAELTDIVVEIGQPHWIEPGIEAACPVALRGDIGRVADIRNIDPMSAMKAAIAFVDIYLDRAQGDTKFFWPNGDEY